MAQHHENDILKAIVVGISLRQDEDDPQMAAFRLPKQIREQLREAASAHHVSKTDVVVQSLKAILPQLLRPADQQPVAKAPAPSIGIGISDLELLEEIRSEQRSW
ncbi:MAG TPA: Arc family DNA-binding protein [Terriglobales bacterium]|nr:Arc family DNA-binding protein [Terriglobales bacterium]